MEAAKGEKIGNSGEVEKLKEKYFESEGPLEDDLCPICLDRYNIPCKTNCGHWFCASCIVRYWMYRSSMQRCKCPLCNNKISKLELEASQLKRLEEEDVESLKKVKQYNSLYTGGFHGLCLKAQALPLFMGRAFQILIDKDGLRCIYYCTRLLGLLLATLYEMGDFDFVPTGGLGIKRGFDIFASALVVIFLLASFFYRWVVALRVRRHVSV